MVTFALRSKYLSKLDLLAESIDLFGTQSVRK
jgi:hypothetical protein